MSNKITGKMFSDSGIKISLSNILNLIPENDWLWAIYEFDAVGLAPNGLSMPDFENLVLSKDYGFSITWVNLKELASSISDINSCILAAVNKPTAFLSISENTEQPLVLVKVTDSTNWEIQFND